MENINTFFVSALFSVQHYLTSQWHKKIQISILTMLLSAQMIYENTADVIIVKFPYYQCWCQHNTSMFQHHPRLSEELLLNFFTLQLWPKSLFLQNIHKYLKMAAIGLELYNHAKKKVHPLSLSQSGTLQVLKWGQYNLKRTKNMPYYTSLII